MQGSALVVSVTGMAKLLRKNLNFNFSKNIMQVRFRAKREHVKCKDAYLKADTRIWP